MHDDDDAKKNTTLRTGIKKKIIICVLLSTEGVRDRDNRRVAGGVASETCARTWCQRS